VKRSSALRHRYGRAALSPWRKIVLAREKTLSSRDIEKLRDGAGMAGAFAQVRVCDRALAGSRKARLVCADGIAEWEASRQGRLG